ncbi:hypothetical protein BpHYR1_041164 [Brachionus plicatilis]|uniref:SWIM-type domain-containing protein n=1 Tax=Brachionus plicatilis TaxID=10195 RepID=A0A3M7PNR9_BRAPC|nr:hypothetical protein BpHYR1_041164 [Brachionus plicatilis]
MYVPALIQYVGDDSIDRAMWFYNKNKVSHNINLGIYNVTDEAGTILQVYMYPNSKCSCAEEKNCSHILAVFIANEKNFESDYKKPNLGQLVRTKNKNKLSGRKLQDEKKKKFQFSVLLMLLLFLYYDLLDVFFQVERSLNIFYEKERNLIFNNLNEILTPSRAQTFIIIICYKPSSYNIAASTSRANIQTFI